MMLQGDGVQKPDGDEEALNGSDLSDLCSPRDEVGGLVLSIKGRRYILEFDH